MTKSNPMCKSFAVVCAQDCGVSYRKAAEKYPRAADPNRVYVNGCETQGGHCVHCARAEALIKYRMDGKK